MVRLFCLVCMQNMSGTESNASRPDFRAKSGDFAVHADNFCLHTLFEPPWESWGYNQRDVQPFTPFVRPSYFCGRRENPRRANPQWLFMEHNRRSFGIDRFSYYFLGGKWICTIVGIARNCDCIGMWTIYDTPGICAWREPIPCQRAVGCHDLPGMGG